MFEVSCHAGRPKSNKAEWVASWMLQKEEILAREVAKDVNKGGECRVGREGTWCSLTLNIANLASEKRKEGVGDKENINQSQGGR